MTPTGAGVSEEELAMLETTHASTDEYIELEWNGLPYMQIQEPTKEARDAWRAMHAAMPKLIAEVRAHRAAALTEEDLHELAWLRTMLRDEAFEPEKWRNAVAILDKLIDQGGK